METLTVRTWFGAVENVAVAILLGKTYNIDRCIKGIFPMDRKFVLLHSAPVPILGKNRDLSKVSSIVWHKALSENSKNHAAIRVAELITIPPEMRRNPQ